MNMKLQDATPPLSPSVNESGTVVEMLGNGEPFRTALIAPGGLAITYGSLRDQVDSLARRLNSMGIGRGDRVAIVLANGLEPVVAFLAVTASGAAAVPLNPGYKTEEFRFCLEDTNAKAIILSTQGNEEITAAIPDSMITIGVSFNDEGRLCATFNDETGGDQRLGPRLGESPSPDDVVLVLHTSGTTSRPKRVPLSHRNLVVSARNVAETYQLSSADVSLCVMPLFHIHGIVASTLATLLSGGTVVVTSGFNALDFWSVVEEHQVTWYSAVPAIHQVLLNREKNKINGDAAGIARRNLRFIRSCSAPFPPETIVEMEEMFGVPVLEAYGMTEAAHQVASNPLSGGKRVLGSVGRGTGVSIAIMDQYGNLEASGVTGEVVIKGPNVTEGYEDNAEANSKCMTNGWFRTGDEGVIDSEGYLTLVGRLKEIIIRSGEKISPREIDETLLTHPSVAEAVAFGAPHPTYGEVPSAAVVLRAPAKPADLIAHCRAHLASFKCPKVIHIVDEIPHTATGKVQRRVVSAAFA